MTVIMWILLSLLVFTAGVIVVLRDWRWMLIGLFWNYVAQALFLAQQQFIVPDLTILGRQFSSLIFIKLITGFGVTAILVITGLTFSRDYGLEDLDEFSLSELRRAARAAQRIKATTRRSPGDYLVPLLSLLLIGLASYFLPLVMPLALRVYADQPALAHVIDFVWYWQILIGLAALVQATDVLKVGLGLLLLISGLDLLYTTLAVGVNILALGLMSLVTLVLALAIAYLSGLLYGRLKTLDLVEMERRT